MANIGSHGRLRRTGVRLVAGIALAAFAAGAWMSDRQNDGLAKQEEKARTASLETEISLLNEGFLSAIEQLRLKSFHLTYRMPRTVEEAGRFRLPAPFHLWAIAYVNRDGTYRLENRLPVGLSGSGFQQHHLDSLPKKIDVKGLQRDGVAAFTIQRDPVGRRQYLGFVFWGKNLSEGELSAKAVLALVDPTEIFRSLEKISSELSDTRRRAYVLSSDGVVLAHTLNGHVGSDFSATEIAREGLEPVLTGALKEVAAEGSSIDGMSVHAVFRKIGALPIAAVIEQVSDRSASALPARLSRAWKASAEPTAAAFLALIAIIAGGTYLLRRRTGSAPAALEAEAPAAEVPALAEFPWAETGATLSELQGAGISTSDSANEQSAGAGGFSVPKTAIRTDAVARQAEQAFESDLDAPKPADDSETSTAAGYTVAGNSPIAASVATRDTADGMAAVTTAQPPRFAQQTAAGETASGASAAGEALTAWEAVVAHPLQQKPAAHPILGDTAKTPRPTEPDVNHTYRLVQRFAAEAGRLRDSRLVAALLTKTAAQLCESPVLFFSFAENIGAAILKEDAGFGDGEAPVSMSFPVDRKALLKITQFARSGKVASLSHYPPLANIVLTRLGVAHFEAWAVTTAAANTNADSNENTGAEPRLLGVLVIVRSGVNSVQHRRSIVGMMKASAGLIQNENTQAQV